MFEQFGKFKSVEELNMSAEGLKAEGDEESLFKLAEENGIDKDDVEDYLDGFVQSLATPLMAVTGRIAVEKAELKLGDILEDWADYIVSVASEDADMAAGVMKGSLADCIAELLKYSYKNMKQLPKEVVKAAGIGNATVKLGIPGAKQAKKIIKDYYMSR